MQRENLPPLRATQANPGQVEGGLGEESVRVLKGALPSFFIGHRQLPRHAQAPASQKRRQTQTHSDMLVSEKI